MPVNNKIVQGNTHGPRSALLLAGLAFLCLVLAYVPALDGPLFFDDLPNLLHNALVQLEGLQFDEWRLAVLSNDSGVLHRPLAMLTFALNYVVAGEFNAVSLKAVNLLVHLANGVLLYCLAAGVLRAPAVTLRHPDAGAQWRLLAAGAATLWLLHPIHVSTVLYAVQRMALLSALFTLAGLVLFLRYRLRWAARGAGAGEVVAAALWLAILSLLAALCKENGLLLPWLVVVLEVTLFRGRWAGRERAGLARAAWIALLLPAAALVLVTLLAPGSLPGSFSGREFTLGERLLTQSRVLWLYLQWLALPDISQLGFFHDDIPFSRSLVLPATTAVAVAAWGLVVVFCLLWHRRFPLTAFAFLFYLVGHSTESTVLPLEMVFEHRNYLPAAGFAVLLAAGVGRLCSRVAFLRPAPVLAILLVLLAAPLVLRSHAWGDMLTLARTNVINHPDSPRANFYYATVLMEEFRRVKDSGADPQRERQLAVATRTHFMRMYELDPRDIAGVVMLYQFDSMHFPDAAARHDWLGVLEELAVDRRLQSADITALGALVEFTQQVPDAGLRAREQARVLAIINRLLERYSRRAALAKHAFLLHVAGGGDPEDMLPALERALRANRRDTLAAGMLVGYYSKRDLPLAYDALREWARRDTMRRELPVIRALLEP